MLSPNSAEALALAGSVALRSEEIEVAQDYATRALALDPGQANAIAIMVALYAADEPTKALEYITTGREANPQNVPVRLLQLKVLDSQGNSDAVIAEYQSLIADYPENSSYLSALANYYTQKDRAEEAEALLRQAVQAKPDDTQTRMQLVQYLMQHSSVGAAMTELEAMLKADPANFKVRSALGDLYAATRQLDKAVELYQASFEYDDEGSASLAARNKLAELALVKNDAETASELLEGVLDTEPNNPEALTTRARIELAAGDHDKAITDLRLVLRSSPESVPAMLLLAGAQQKDRSDSLALDNYEKVLRLQPESPIALFQSARLLSKDEQYPEAAANIEKLLESQPDNLEAINLLADIYSRQERWDEAVALTRRLAPGGG